MTQITISKWQLLGLVFGILVSWGLSLHQYLLFMKAYFSPEKAVVLYINKFHEANIEVVMLTVSMLLATVVIGYIIHFLYELKKTDQSVSLVKP